MSNTMINLSKILVAIDGSQASMDAADYAIEIARKDKCQLIALTVLIYSICWERFRLEQPLEFGLNVEYTDYETSNFLNHTLLLQIKN